MNSWTLSLCDSVSVSLTLSLSVCRLRLFFWNQQQQHSQQYKKNCVCCASTWGPFVFALESNYELSLLTKYTFRGYTKFTTVFFSSLSGFTNPCILNSRVKRNFFFTFSSIDFKWILSRDAYAFRPKKRFFFRYFSLFFAIVHLCFGRSFAPPFDTTN